MKKRLKQHARYNNEDGRYLCVTCVTLFCRLPDCRNMLQFILYHVLHNRTYVGQYTVWLLHVSTFLTHLRGATVFSWTQSVVIMAVTCFDYIPHPSSWSKSVQRDTKRCNMAVAIRLLPADGYIKFSRNI